MRIKVDSILLSVTILIFFIFLILKPSGIVFAATPTPSPPSVSDSPDPANSSEPVTITCSGCSASGGTIKLFVCKDSACSNCKGEVKSVSPSFSTYGSYGGSNALQYSPENTSVEDTFWGYILVYDAWVAQDVGGRWTWDFGASYTGTFKIKWYAKITGDYLPTYCVNTTYGIYASNDGSTWTAIRTGSFYHATGSGAWSPYTSVYFDKITGTYRYIKAELYSTTSCMVNNAQLWIDVVRLDYEVTSNCWCSSSYVGSNPSCVAKTCGDCEYSVNSYWAMTGGNQTFNFDHYVYSSITSSEATFTCKKRNLCTCSVGECYSGTGSGVNEGCKQDPDGDGKWCCNTNQCSHNDSCYTLVELTSPEPEKSACILGENIAHNTQGITNYRYATYDGQLYYCGTDNTDKDAHDQTTDLIPNDKIGLCQCRWDGTWNCGGVVVIRGGRIIILPT